MISAKADLHIHTFLSPCGDIGMTPLNIVRQAKAKGLQLIAVTDHNSTLQGPVVRRVGEREGLAVIYGAEITTREEVHCLAYVETEEQRLVLQHYLEQHLPPVPNNPDIFGYQLWVDENEQVLGEAPFLLISGIDQGIDQVAGFVHSIGGLFVPAHIERPRNSLISQLGFVPPGLTADALELSRFTNPVDFCSKNTYLKKYTIIQSSDAHYPGDIGSASTSLLMEKPGFEGLKTALTTPHE
ncbi:MAG: PHP domain-containing protein [Bacteroidales bacterium]|jgi:PHP family Zn ribbon phosphoesterase|nr:PHP domain-containing protein [Bacteroidales bacterium]NLH23190.1 PHP domain-containing protein [Bacteroidales bacterium]HPJ83098.1 PHP domain-containing protein [Bacteroidales bacterium]